MTTISLWIPKFKKIPLWTLLVSISVLFALISKRIDGVALLLIFILAISTFFLGNCKIPIPFRILSALFLGILAIGFGLFGMHPLPNFDNLLILSRVHVSQNAIPFSLYLNFDKTIVGIFILGFLHQRISTKQEWKDLFRNMIPKALVLTFIILCLSLSIGFGRFDFKISYILLIWLPTNLLFVCLAEEAFFRGFIQKYLAQSLQNISYGNGIAIAVASFLFGLSHFTGGPIYILLSTIAGFGYGCIYFKAQKIEASILAHFFLNTIHILFFTYPALAVST
jgi:membrane protease YdiL (CAAX protease family)